MVVIGQIISLFGNSVLRFAIPLYLLNQTQSASLFGLVSALSFIPMILLAPIGGIIADRVNKRNVMVILDFSTAALTLIFFSLLGKVDLVVLIIVTLIILFGIQGAYSPAVQASIPALIAPEDLVPANSVITLVNSLSSLIGPVIGGAVYAFYGIIPVLVVSVICFLCSAIMEIFIHIPYKKKKSESNIFKMAKNDLTESVNFIKNGHPVVLKIGFIAAGINLVLSALFIIGLPVIITQKLDFPVVVGNQLYGYCEGVTAAGGLIGGILAGVLSKKLHIQKAAIFLFICAILLIPIGISILVGSPAYLTYGIILFCVFLSMVASTMFSIEILAYIQLITSEDLIGKIMAIAMCLCMCATPLGQAIYGVLFDKLTNNIPIIFFIAAILSLIIAFISKGIIHKLPKHSTASDLPCDSHSSSINTQAIED